MQPNTKIEIKNEIQPQYKANSPAKILFSAVKVVNANVYKITIIEFGNGTRRLYIERQASERLPRAIVPNPPAPLLHYVRKLKQIYGVE
jgi:hypothetical protein